MRVFLFIILVIYNVLSSTGQVAIIHDEDGWTNVRKSPDLNSEIIHKVYENDVFWYDIEDLKQNQEWISVFIPKNDYCLGNTEPSYIIGYIHSSRILPLDNLQKYTGNDFFFEYKLSEFDSTNRIIDKQDGKWVVAIDGRPAWGTDGNYPKVQVDDITLIINGKEINIHKVFYSDIFECDNQMLIYKNDETFFVHQWNSDGAGTYEIVWVFDQNGLKQRLVGLMF